MRVGSEIAEIRQLGPGARRAAGVAAAVGVAGVAVGLVDGLRSGWDVFFRAYLLNYTFVLSLALGALFFVLLQHVTRAGWSVSLRRLAEQVAGLLPALTLLALPLLIPVLGGMAALYPWTDPHAVAADPLLQHKRPYLNVPFFVARLALYFAVWWLLAGYYRRLSLRQDASGELELTQRMQYWSGAGLLAYALTVTGFAVDALMSLNPHWYSTIWGVYFFSGSAVGFFALLALLAWGVQQSGALGRSLTVEHYHDVGKLVFAFVVFWAYIAFSQYMLIWYANLPEETFWFRVRQAGPWWAGVGLLLLFGHFLAPFVALLSRYPKRRPRLLAAAAAWVLLMHWLDLYYMVIPRPDTGGPGRPPVHEAAPLHVADVALLAGLGGLCAAVLIGMLRRQALVPARDPRLAEALRFENV